MPSSRQLFRALALPGVVLVACAQGPAGSAPGAGEAGGADTAAWGRVLRDHAHAGGVDYAALAAARDDLDAYLASLAAVGAAELGRDEAIAFWSNAYNAVVLAHVLDRYPGIESVKAVDGFFDELTFPVAGEELTLDEIEGRALALDEPRVHFAVVCASTSCPDLRPEPFRGATLDRQLDEQTAAFLADPAKGMRWEPDSGTLWLSSIFKWYAGDFTGGSTVIAFFSRGGVADWVLERLPAERAAAIGEPRRVRYLDYDWGLNDRPRP